MSDSLRSHELQHARPKTPYLICSWFINTELAARRELCHSCLDQAYHTPLFPIKHITVFPHLGTPDSASALCLGVISSSKVKVKHVSRSPCLTLFDLLDCGPPGSSVHGILQERIYSDSKITNRKDKNAAWTRPQKGHLFTVAELKQAGRARPCVTYSGDVCRGPLERPGALHMWQMITNMWQGLILRFQIKY